MPLMRWAVAAKDEVIATLRETHVTEIAALTARISVIQSALDTLRQAEADRKGRSRLARLRAAWRRGE